MNGEETATDSMLRRVCGLSYLAVLGTYLCQLIGEPDFFSHLLVGDFILEHRSFPTRDYWYALNYSSPRYPLSWAFDVLVSAVFGFGSWQGLALLKLILSVALVFALQYCFERETKRNFVSYLLTTVVACGILESTLFASSLIGYALGVLLLSVRKEPRSKLLLAGFAITLTNVDASSYLLFGSLFFLLAAFRPLELLIFIVSGCCSPYLGVHLLYAVAELFADFGLALRDPLEFVNLLDYRFCFIILLFVVFALLTSGMKLSRNLRTSVVAAFVFTLFGVFERSAFSAGLFLLAWSLAIVWSEVKESHNLRVSVSKLKTVSSRLPAPGIIWLFFCLLIVNSLNFYRAPYLSAFLPVAALDRVLETGKTGTFWHESFVGPYVAYRFRAAGSSLRAQSDRSVLAFHPELKEVERGRKEFFLERTKEVETYLVRRQSRLYEILVGQRNFEVLFPSPLSSEDGRQRSEFWAVLTRRIEK